LRPTARTPPRQIRRCRRRFRTTAPNEPERLPSGRPEPCGPGRLHRACSYTRTASPRTLSLAASLAHLVKGWGVASNYPALIRLASRRPEPGSKKMRLPTSATDLTKRAPCGSIDSQERFPRSLAALRCGAIQVELRLTANLQLRLCHNLLCGGWGFWPQIPPEHGASRSWRGCDRQPLRQTLPATVLSTANRACNVASDTLCRDPRRTSMASRPTSAATNRQARLHRLLVKGDGLIGPGCLPSTSAPSARFTRRSRGSIRGFNGNPTPFRLLVQPAAHTRR